MLPPGQGTQMSEPTLGAMRPGGQGKHATEPGALVNVP